MRPFLAGFVDELVKLSASEMGGAAAAGTGIKPPPKIKLPMPGKPPAGPKPLAAPKFGAPPGLKPPRLARVGMAGAKLPSTTPRLPVWQRPS